MWQSIKCVYGAARRTLAEGTPVDKGRILPHFPQPNGYGPWWMCYLCYELMIEAEHRFRIKQGGGAGHRRPSPSAGNASPCPRDKLEDVAWNKPDSKTLEHLVWSVYDGILLPGPTLKLKGPESYNQVTRCLASKVFRGLQVCCPTRTSAQFDEPNPVKVRSVVFATPPSGMPKKPEATESWTRPLKVNTAEERPVGGETDVDPNIHLMTWMRDRQNSYSDEKISFWPLLRPLTDGGGMATRHLACRLLSTWQWSSAATHRVLPSRPKQHGGWAMATPGQGGKKGRSMDGGLRLLLTTRGGSIRRAFLANRRWGNGPTSQPSGAGIPDRNGKQRKSILCERMLAIEEWYRTKTAYEHSSCPHNPLSG